MKKTILFMVLIFSVYFTKAQGNISGFEILSEYLLDGKVLINPNSATTEVKYQITYSRPANGASVNFYYSLGTTGGSNGLPVFFENSHNVTNSTFGTNIFLKSETITVSIEKSKLIPGNKIFLFYQVDYQESVNAFNFKNYDFVTTLAPTTPTTPTTPPSYTPPVAGAVPFYEYYRASNGTHFYSTNWVAENYSSILGYVFKTLEAGTSPLYVYHSSTYNKYQYSFQLSNNLDGDYVYRGVACYVYTNPVTKSRPIVKHYTSTSKDYYFFDGPGTFTGYSLQGSEFYILQNQQVTTYPLPEEDTMELYQYYSNDGDHFYTTSKKERSGFTHEKVLGYVHTIQKTGTIPLYRYYTSVSIAKDHYYTTVKDNYNNYLYEGIVGYVYPGGGVNGTTPIYSYYASVNGDHYYNNINANYGGYVNEGIKFWMLQYNH